MVNGNGNGNVKLPFTRCESPFTRCISGKTGECAFYLPTRICATFLRWKLGRVLYWTFLCWEPNLNRTFFLYVQKPEKNCWELNLRNMRNCYAARPEKLRKNMKLDKHVAAPEKHAAGHFWILEIIHVVSKILMCLVMYLVNCNSNTTNSYRFHPDGMYLVIHTGFILMKCIL
jgi:hypothetical protein